MASASASTPTRESFFAWMPAFGVQMASTSISSLVAYFRIAFKKRGWTLAVVTAVGLAMGSAARSATPRFYPDDPLWTDDDRAFDASKVGSIEDTNAYDFVINSFGSPGERRDVRALNVNTIDEVPDSSWFTNRIGRREMTVAEVVKGPDQSQRVSLEGWVVSGGKGAGIQPGFRMADPSGQTYQIEVDPPSNPELASGVEIIGTAFYHAMGYHTVEVYPVQMDRTALVISEQATIRDPLNGKRRRMKQTDLDVVFNRAPPSPPAHPVCSSADLRPASRWATSGTTAHAPTIRTTSWPTSIGASCALRGVSVRGSITPTLAASTASTCWRRTAAERGSSTTCSTSAPSSAAGPCTPSVIVRATNTSSSNGLGGLRWRPLVPTSGHGC